MLTRAQVEAPVASWDDFFVDIGIEQADEARELGIYVGSPVVFRTQPRQVGRRIVGTSMDDHICLCVIELLLEAQTRTSLACELFVGATVQEENGLHGARAMARRQRFDHVIALDVGLVGDIPSVGEASYPARLGGGPIIVHKDALVAYDHSLSWALGDLADSAGLPWQHGVFAGYGSDGIPFIQEGMPTALVCIPTRYTHSPFEMIDPRVTAVAIDGLVTVPGGSYVIGTDNPWIPADGEGPRRVVELASFRIAPCAVTVAEFTAFAEDTGFVTDAERAGWSFVFVDEVGDDATIVGHSAGAPWWVGVEGTTWRDALDADPDHPVVHISWNDATAYCRWLGVRLPTEMEWEVAASGGVPGRIFPWGNELMPSGVHMCNVWQGSFPSENTGDDGFRGRAPVNAFLPNDFGLFNMVGNVWEWCADTLGRTGTPSSCCSPAPSGEKVQKGGSYLCHDSYCARYRIQARIGSSPDSSTGNVGFRIAK